MKALIIFATLVASVFCQQQQLFGPFDAVRTKLNSAISVLNNHNEEPTVILAALSTGLDAVFGGNMIVLPSLSGHMEKDTEVFGQMAEHTQGKNYAMDFERGSRTFNVTISNIDLLLNALNGFLSGTAPSMTKQEGERASNLPARAIVLEAKDFLVFTKEVLMNLARYTIRCNPNLDLASQGDICRVFLTSDESEPVMDDVLNRMNMKFMDNAMFRQIRSPFFFPRTWLMFDAERSIVEGSRAGSDFGIMKYQTGSLENGQCSVILESIIGVRAIFRPATLTVWNMPWLGASSMIGKKAFVFEWVPAELLKTISLCQSLNPSTMRSEIVQHVGTETILQRGALLFWQIFA